jgi:hypothetical protein
LYHFRSLPKRRKRRVGGPHSSWCSSWWREERKRGKESLRKEGEDVEEFFEENKEF